MQKHNVIIPSLLAAMVYLQAIWQIQSETPVCQTQSTLHCGTLIYVPLGESKEILSANCCFPPRKLSMDGIHGRKGVTPHPT